MVGTVELHQVTEESGEDHGSEASVISDVTAIEILERFQMSVGGPRSAEHLSRMRAAVGSGLPDLESVLQFVEAVDDEVIGKLPMPLMLEQFFWMWLERFRDEGEVFVLEQPYESHPRSDIVDGLRQLLQTPREQFPRMRPVIEFNLALYYVLGLGSMYEDKPENGNAPGKLRDLDPVFLMYGSARVRGDGSIAEIVRHAVRHNNVEFSDGLVIFRNIHRDKLEGRYIVMGSDLVDAVLEIVQLVEGDPDFVSCPKFMPHLAECLRTVHGGGMISDGSVQLMFQRFLYCANYDLIRVPYLDIVQKHFRKYRKELEARFLGMDPSVEAGGIMHNDDQDFKEFDLSTLEGKADFCVETHVAGLCNNALEMLMKVPLISYCAARLYVSMGGTLPDGLVPLKRDEGHWHKKWVDFKDEMRNAALAELRRQDAEIRRTDGSEGPSS